MKTDGRNHENTYSLKTRIPLLCRALLQFSCRALLQFSFEYFF
jgi:hypothetical protein